MGDKILYAALGGFGAGVFVRSFVNFGAAFSAFFLLLGAILFLYEKLARAETAFPRGRILFVALFLFSLGLGMFRFDLSELGARDAALDSRLGTAVTFEGVLIEEPDEREDKVFLTVRVDSLLMEGAPTPVEGTVLITADFYPELRYGDRVRATGRLEKPKRVQSEDSRDFDYPAYLAKEGIYYQSFRPHLEKISSGNGNLVKSALFRLKNSFIQNVERVIPEPHAALLAGLVVGAKHSLGAKLLDDFRRAGVIHIVVLSGYNITIVAKAVMKFFSFLPRSAGQLSGALGIVLFAIMTGGSATVVRSSIMALLVILAEATGRTYRIKRALLLAGFFMILQNPKILAFDSSFQLSFLSTLALIYVSPRIEKYFRFVPERFGLREVVTATVATQVFVLPMLLYKMGEVSLVALPVNLLVLAVIPATMFFGFLAGAVGFASALLSLPFAYGAYALLAYELGIVEWFAALPFASVSVAHFPLLAALSVYFIYLVFYAFLWLPVRSAKEEAT